MLLISLCVQRGVRFVVEKKEERERGDVVSSSAATLLLWGRRRRKRKRKRVKVPSEKVLQAYSGEFITLRKQNPKLNM